MISALLLFLALPQTAQPAPPALDPHAGHDLAAPAAQAAPGPRGALEPIAIERVKLQHPFFVERLVANHKTTLPHCLTQLEQTGRIQAFAQAAAADKGKREDKPAGRIDGDADVYRTLAGIGWSSIAAKDPALESRADAVIDAIAAAQRADGYLNTLVQRSGGEPWKDAASELATGGHLIEAGVAYARGTQKTKLLEVATRFAALVEKQFAQGPGKDAGGLSGIELGLTRLHEHTREARWLELAKTLAERGGAGGTQSLRGLGALPAAAADLARAATACAGTAEVAMRSGDATWAEPLGRLWADAWAKTQLTGGVGDAQTCSTCAGLALAQWSQRMLLMTGESKYGDAVERVLYNLAAGATDLAGGKFVDAEPAGGDVRRQPWPGNTCCVTSLASFWPQVPGFVFAQNGNSLYWLQLAKAEVDTTLAGSQVHAVLQSDLPNSGRMNATITCDKPAVFTIKLRRPAWNVEAMVKHDMKEQEHELHDHEQGAGWVPFERNYETTDGFLIHFLAPIRRVRPDAGAADGKGRVALMRGPLVYCFEGVDNGGSARSVCLPAEAELKVEQVNTMLGGTRVIRARGKRAVLGPDGAATTKVATVTAVPYHVWDNRAPGDMIVWIPESPDLAEPQGAAK
jgi:DUF1680 family protein